jgi:phage tail sheath gpL-like
MADSSTSNPGFTLPSPTAPGSQADAGQGSISLPVPVLTDEPSSRDVLLGGGVLLVLMLAYFFAKNAYANVLVGKRVEPRSANAAGWWLFIFLTLISVGVVLAAVGRSMLMTPFIVGPLAVGAIVALVLMLLSGRR